MTPREYLALKRVWASKEASFHNAHFRGADDAAYLPEDFIDPSARVTRKAALMRAKADTMMEKQRMEMMKKGQPSGGVPEAFLVIGKVN